jgi:hypothetical protein
MSYKYYLTNCFDLIMNTKGELMAQLTKCIECGKDISSKAIFCPHCQTKYPKGTECVVCKKNVRVSSGKNNFGIVMQTMHTACFDEINQCQYSCPVCKNLITKQDAIVYAKDDYGRDKHTEEGTCAKCGHPIPVKFCRYCHQRLIKDTAVKLSEREAGIEIRRFTHQACYSSRHSRSVILDIVYQCFQFFQ